MSLNDYFQQHIFSPLGLQNISMFPSKKMKEKLAYMNARAADGQLHPRDHLLHRPLVVEGPDIATCVNSGGAGCFAKPQEYCRTSSANVVLAFADIFRNPRDVAE